MLGSSVFAASRAGGPLYESRLALEDLTLPADPDARIAAQLAQADARLGEAVEAGFRHDDRAVAAALDAYDRTLEELTSASGAAADEAFEMIREHQAVLLQLAAQVPSTATNGIDLALANGNRVMGRLADGGAAGPGNGVGTPLGNGYGANGGGNAGGGQGAGQDGGNAGGNGSGNANGAGNGNGSNPAAGTPAPTAKPTDAPTATPTDKPDTGPQSSHDPGRTPKPHDTPPATPNAPPAPDGGTPSPTEPVRP